MTDDLLMTPEELVSLTGYTRSSAQVEELHRQGFVRARRNALGTVVLERAHYLAVCSGTFGGRVPEPELRLNFEWPPIYALTKRPARGKA
jgi:hypothetical protein